MRVDQQSFHHDSSQSPKREPGSSISSFSRQGAWGPRWLRITTISSFALAIIVPIIAIPILADRSKRNDGLGNGGQDLEYILKFAPVACELRLPAANDVETLTQTADFTLIAAMWTRAELQAMRYTPWAAVAEGRDLGKHGLTLDYADMFWWIALWRSLKNRHMLVFAVMLVSLLLKVTIPLAAGLVHSATVGLPASLEVQVLDTFSPDLVPADLNRAARQNEELGLYVPFYQLKAISNFDMEYPFGMTENEAYQTFEVPGIPFDPSIQATAVVDRIQTDLVCDLSKSFTVQNHTSFKDAGYDRRPGFFTDIEFEFGKCEKWRATLPPFFWETVQHPDSADGANRMSWMYGMGPSGKLSDTPRASCGLTATPREFLLISTTQRRAGVNDSVPVSFDAVAMICSPKTWTSKVEVSRDGSDTRLAPLADSPLKELSVDIDGLVQSFVPTTIGDWRSSIDSQNVTDWVFSALRYAVEFRDGAFINGGGPIHPTMNQTEIRDVLTQFYRKVGTMGIHAMLRTPAKQKVVGSVVAQTGRVLVNGVVAYILVGILGAILLGMAATRLCLPTRGLYDVDPTTILGAAVAFKKAPAFLRQGRTDTGVLKTSPSWEKPNTAPYLLRSETRLISITLLMGLIAALLVTLNISNTSNGIVSIPTEGYNPIVSSIVPTVLLLLVAMYAGASNASVRNLTTFSNASARDCGPKDLSLSFLDMIGPRVLWHSTTRHIWTMTLTETAATLAAFLTTFAGLLLRVENIEVSSVVQLQQASWFGNPDLAAAQQQTDVIPDGRQMITSFLLNSTSTNAITYTPGSYQDLIFPLFERPADSTMLSGNNVTVRLTVPALTLQATCVDLAPSDYNITVRPAKSNRGDPVCNIELSTLSSNGTSLGFVRIPDMKTNTYGHGELALYPHVRTTVSEAAMEQYPRARVIPGSGSGSANCTQEIQRRIHDWWVETYFWGKVAPTNTTMEYSRMARCNYTWTEVDTDIALKGNDLSLDYSDPPKPRWGTRRAPAIRYPIPSVGGQWQCPQVTDRGFLDLPATHLSQRGDRFAVVEAPFGSLPASAYGSDVGKSAVLNALTRMTSIVYAQAASLDNRLPPDGTSMTEPVRQETLPTTVATVANFDRMRLIQRPVPTYILVALLGVIAAINVYALLSAILVRYDRDGSPLCLDMTMQNVAPANSGSIAVMARLLSSSNILKHIPDPSETGEHLQLERVRGVFEGMTFRIGWFQSPTSGQPVFTVGYLGDERMAFLGRKMEGSRQQSAAEGDLGYSNYQ